MSVTTTLDHDRQARRQPGVARDVHRLHAHLPDAAADHLAEIQARLREVQELPPAPVGGDPAGELIRYLERARDEERYDELVLVAAPAFLEKLRTRLGDRARDSLVGAIQKNLVAAGREVLQEEVLRVL